jgi:hypothetical protein
MVQYYTGWRKKFSNRRATSFGWKYAATWSTVPVAILAHVSQRGLRLYPRPLSPPWFPQMSGHDQPRSLLLRLLQREGHAGCELTASNSCPAPGKRSVVPMGRETYVPTRPSGSTTDVGDHVKTHASHFEPHSLSRAPAAMVMPVRRNGAWRSRRRSAVEQIANGEGV